MQEHDLDSRSYRGQYGITRSQALSARASTAMRKQLAMAVRPWEKARAVKQAAQQGQASANGTSTRAKTPSAAPSRRHRRRVLGAVRTAVVSPWSPSASWALTRRQMSRVRRRRVVHHP